jgi:hypothetical protein
MIKKYYCHSCAKQQGLIDYPSIGKSIQTKYQWDKYEKHTEIISSYQLQSIFSVHSTSVYADYVVNSLMEGAVEIEERGPRKKDRKNIIWCAGKHTGFRYEAGVMIRPTDAVKVVLSSATSSIHAFPENSANFSTATCCECGNLIVY